MFELGTDGILLLRNVAAAGQDVLVGVRRHDFLEVSLQCQGEAQCLGIPRWRVAFMGGGIVIRGANGAYSHVQNHESYV